MRYCRIPQNLLDFCCQQLKPLAEIIHLSKYSSQAGDGITLLSFSQLCSCPVCPLLSRSFYKHHYPRPFRNCLHCKVKSLSCTKSHFKQPHCYYICITITDTHCASIVKAELWFHNKYQQQKFDLHSEMSPFISPFRFVIDFFFSFLMNHFKQRKTFPSLEFISTIV